jgi:hypothetical protein
MVVPFSIVEQLDPQETLVAAEQCHAMTGSPQVKMMAFQQWMIFFCILCTHG